MKTSLFGLLLCLVIAVSEARAAGNVSIKTGNAYATVHGPGVVLVLTPGEWGVFASDMNGNPVGDPPEGGMGSFSKLALKVSVLPRKDQPAAGRVALKLESKELVLSCLGYNTAEDGKPPVRLRCAKPKVQATEFAESGVAVTKANCNGCKFSGLSCDVSVHNGGFTAIFAGIADGFVVQGLKLTVLEGDSNAAPTCGDSIFESIEQEAPP